jgi:hypothetical protein
LAVGVDQAQVDAHAGSVVDDESVVAGSASTVVHVVGETLRAGEVALAVVDIVPDEAAGAERATEGGAVGVQTDDANASSAQKGVACGASSANSVRIGGGTARADHQTERAG